MHRSFRLVILTLFVCSLTLTSTLPIHAATFNPGCTGTTGDAAALQAAVNTANTNGQPDTINLVTGCTYTPTTTLIINADGGNLLTVNGNGAAISGDGSRRVMTINAGSSVELNSVSVINGSGGSFGGGIYTNNATVTINSSAFSNNQAGTYGAAIFSNTSTLIINSSTFSNNLVNYYAGAIYSDNSGVSISNSTFSNNSAGQAGGAIFSSTGSTLTIDTSTFSDNSASLFYGGAIYNVSGTLTIDTSTFSDNSAVAGGSIFSGSPTSITDSRFFRNTAQDVGDAVYLTSSLSRSITGSCFVGNGDPAVVSNNVANPLTATGNWWGTAWGPNIPAAPAGTGSFNSVGDSISGNGTTPVNVGLTSYGVSDTAITTVQDVPPTGNWLLTAPNGCGTCADGLAPSSLTRTRVCS